MIHYLQVSEEIDNFMYYWWEHKLLIFCHFESVIKHNALRV